MHIRDERPSDVQTIYNITKSAFKPMPYSAGDEQDLIDALREDGALAVSLVAERDTEIVGHIAFSRVKIGEQPGNWQSLGIGSALIREGIKRIEAMGADGCVLLGYPSYYGRFGFTHNPDLTYLGEANPNFQQLTIRGETPKGAVSYHPAFAV
jgi:putative acetyltransferase